MTTLLNPVVPSSLPHVALRPERDVATEAVLRYFDAADSREQADAFDHLVRFCYLWTKAMLNKQTGAAEPKYFLRDRHGSVTVDQTPQFSNVDGERTGYNVRKEGDAVDVTRQWVQEWLLKFLGRYRGKSHDEIIAAADAGKFRWLGLWCRLALKTIVYRRHKREAKEQFTSFATATESIGTTELGSVSSLRTHAPFEEEMDAVSNAERVVLAHAEELEKLDLLTGIKAYLAEAEYVMKPHFEGRVTRAIAEALGVSERAAREYKLRYHETVERELDASNQTLLAIINELTHEPLTFVMPEGSDENSDKQRLLRESRQLMAEYAHDCQDQRLVLAAAAARNEGSRQGKEAERLEEELPVQ